MNPTNNDQKRVGRVHKGYSCTYDVVLKVGVKEILELPEFVWAGLSFSGIYVPIAKY